MTTLPGYHLGETLYQGTRTQVYRGTRTTDSQPVVIKFLRNEYPSFSELVQFRNQYTIAKNLDLPGIVKPLALETHGNGYALVMTDEGYISLEEWRKGQFSLADFLVIALQLADILYGLYQNRVIHKDIKPANILIHPQTKQIKLIDFSLSSLLPKETQEISNPNVLEGTLAYISPEQTGRMNRGIDYRTDFYSLGVTFYELLTGELPFKSDDPMELVHCHIAKPPSAIGSQFSVISEEIPQVVSDLVMKLMAKNAEDRYQSALGLKYDLEKCLCPWKETEEIEPFELGERDICDRFIIPEKLYGREVEVETLLAAFERVAAGNSEMMLVAGFSGIGKTAVVNEVHKPIVRQRGYFIKGKFDQFNRNIPFSAFVYAFRDLMGQLLSESDVQLQQWKSNILNALGDSGQVIIDVIPELEVIIGQQPAVAELSGSAAQNRFNLLLGKFVRVFATKDHPLVLFLDDLQWADSASLNLMKVLMDDEETGYLLLLGAYRDNEVFPAHPLMLTLSELEKDQAVISTITLNPLALSHINQLVAETLSCDEELSQPLTELIYQKTKGNPFFTTQFLKGLHEDELITFNLNLGYWECDLVQVRDAALTDDVVEFMAGRLQKLSEATQNVLKLAACIGNQFELETLAMVCEDSSEEVAADIWSALQEGLVLPLSESYKFFQGDKHEAKGVEEISVGYRFLHDRVQQAAYSFFQEQEKKGIHYHIGQMLWRSATAEEMEAQIFTIVDHLNMGIELVTESRERQEIIKLNLYAGQKAKASTAYNAAVNYLRMGRELLEDQSWTLQYQLTLDLYLQGIEAEYLSSNYEVMQYLFDVVLKQTKTVLDRIKAYEVMVQFQASQNQMQESINTGLQVLEMLGVELAKSPPECENPEELYHLEGMSNSTHLSAISILVNLFGPAFVANPELLPFIIFTMVNLSLISGNSIFAPYIYSLYGFLLCTKIEKQSINLGYKYGQVGSQLIERLQAKAVSGKAVYIFNTHVRTWKEHIRVSMEPLRNAMVTCLEAGDLEFAGYSTLILCENTFILGIPLDSAISQHIYCINFAEKIKQEYPVIHNRIWGQLTENLMGEVGCRDKLVGRWIDEEKLLPKLQKSGNQTLLFMLYLAKAVISYTLQDFPRALSNSKKARSYEQAIAGNLTIVLGCFYHSLSLLVLHSSMESEEQNESLRQVVFNQEKMKIWAEEASINFQHKYDLVEAERHRFLGQKAEAIELYDRSIAGAKENEYLQEEALANELAAKFYLDWGKEKIAATYMVEAYYCYARWGAKAKTDHLEATYPQLLTPILQQPKSSLTLNATTTLTSHQTVRTSTHTSTNTTSSLLDISAAVKASQALSGEIELEALLSQLMHIVFENAGADKGTFVLNNGGTWEVVAQCEKETCELSATPLDNAHTLPVSIARAVQRTQQAVILNQVEKDTRFASDTYLIQQQPKSLFCTPILNQGQLIGILYLENNLSAGAFTTERVEILNLLCSQAAISIENARLYEQSQNYAKKLEGTVQELQQTQQQLQKAFEELQQAQLQMVQSEKMSALGNLVAGVAHEINNPVGFIGGNLQPAQDYVQDLFGLIDLYQEKYPDGEEEIEEEIEAIDLEFLRSDLPKLISSMKLGVERIAHISTSLRTFSRTDKEHKVPFNLHAGIDSTILILKHRLKANEHRPEIKIVKEYGNIPEVQCFPGQLNQVFMNLIANAIDALDEGNSGRSFEDIAAHPNQITIQTDIQEDRVTIRIGDNGVGMPEEVRGRIFEQGFTTKGVGKGTGLGMAIARQIIEEKHGGTISCTSQLGKGTQFEIDLP